METFRGDMRWEREKTGNPITDYTLLQEVSIDNPESFWPDVFKQVRFLY
jgi:hypothetical protein